jgi:hypothetical protein
VQRYDSTRRGASQPGAYGRARERTRLSTPSRRTMHHAQRPRRPQAPRTAQTKLCTRLGSAVTPASSTTCERRESERLRRCQGRAARTVMRAPARRVRGPTRARARRASPARRSIAQRPRPTGPGRGRGERYRARVASAPRTARRAPAEPLNERYDDATTRKRGGACDNQHLLTYFVNSPRSPPLTADLIDNKVTSDL